MKIFIGYRRDDGGHARAVYQHLRLWFDERIVFLDHESLDPGEKYKPALTRHIEESALFLAVIGQHWYSEKNQFRLVDEEDITRGELRTALQKGIPIIPLILGGAPVPPQNQLPSDIAAFLDANVHPIPDSEYVSAQNSLIDHLKTLGFKPRYRPPHGVSQAYHLGDYKLSEYFTDPADTLGRLHDMLTAEGKASVVGRATLQGMGGVGKTQLALKYSESCRDQYAGIWWFKAETLLQLQQDYQVFCATNGFSLFEGEEPHRAIKRFFQQQPRWLLVFDNAEPSYGEKMEHLRPYLPGGDHHLIITARSPDLDDETTTLPLDVWSEDQALVFLKKRLPKATDDDLRQLTKALGGLPLALEQACAYLKKTGSSITAYCAAIDNIQRSSSLLDREAARENGYDYSVLATLSLAFDKLSGPARHLLRLCAWCAPEPIPELIFRNAANELPAPLQEAAEDDLSWGETVAELTGYALAQRVEVDLTPRGQEKLISDRALLLHRLTQSVVIHKLCEPATDAPALTDLVRRSFPGDLSTPGTWPLARALGPHVLKLEEHFAGGNVPHQALSWLLDRLATYLRNGPSLYEKAVAILRRVLELDKRVLGEHDPDTLTSMGNLSVALMGMGEAPEARALSEKMLDICEKNLEEDHPATPIAMLHLAGALKATGSLPEARDLEEKALEIFEKKHGKEHRYTLACMTNLALTLKTMGDPLEAKALQERTLDICEKSFGEESPDTLTAMSNLAGTLFALGDPQRARALEEKALVTREKILGKVDLATTISAFNLFVALLKMGNRTAAQAIINEHLSWILVEGVALQSASQREIRDRLRQIIGSSGPTATETPQQSAPGSN